MLYFRCPACGDLNRVSVAAVVDAPGCARCGAALDVRGQPRDVTDAELARLVATSPIPVVADFWAPWCGPCRLAYPHLEALARRHAGEIVVVRVNTEQERDTMQALALHSIPTLVVYRAGKVVARHAGTLEGPKLEGFVAPHLSHIWAVT